MLLKKQIVRFAALVTAVLVSACKVEISTPEHTRIHSPELDFECPAGSTCLVDVDSMRFFADFFVEPDPGYIFIQWNSGNGYLCGDSTSYYCRIDLTGVPQSDALWRTVHHPDLLIYLDPLVVKGTPYLQAIETFEDARLAQCDIRNRRNRRPEYAEEAVYLRCSSGFISSIHGLENFPYVRDLEIRDYGGVDNTPLQALKHLRELLLERVGTEPLDISFLKGLHRLREVLILSDNSFVGLEEEVIDTPFEEFAINVNSNQDVQQLSNLRNTKGLHLLGEDPYYAAKALDLRPVGKLSKLEKLELSDVKIYTGLETWGNLTALEEISIMPILSQASFNYFSLLPSLKDITVRGEEITSLEPLAELELIERVDVSNSSVTDISGLRNKPHLERVNLAFNDISDVSSIADWAVKDGDIVLILLGNSISKFGSVFNHFKTGRIDLSHNPLDCNDLRNLFKNKSENLQITHTSGNCTI